MPNKSKNQLRIDATIDKQTFSIDEIAKLLGVGRNTTYKAVREGNIPSIRIGRQLLIPKSWVEKTLSISAVSLLRQ